MVERDESLPVLSGVKPDSGTVRRYYIEAEEEVWDCELPCNRERERAVKFVSSCCGSTAALSCLLPLEAPSWLIGAGAALLTPQCLLPQPSQTRPAALTSAPAPSCPGRPSRPCSPSPTPSAWAASEHIFLACLMYSRPACSPRFTVAQPGVDTLPCPAPPSPAQPHHTCHPLPFPCFQLNLPADQCKHSVWPAGSPRPVTWSTPTTRSPPKRSAGEAGGFCVPGIPRKRR